MINNIGFSVTSETKNLVGDRSVKRCNKCRIVKLRSEFTKWNKGSDGLKTRCRKCLSEEKNMWMKRKRIYNRVRSFRWKNELRNQHKIMLSSQSKNADVEKRKDTLLQSRYGITLNDYNKLFEKQNGVCVICGSGPGKRSLRVDHCHKTGKVRALLCTHCNTAIGHVFEDVNTLRNIIEYLEAHTHEARNSK